MSDGAKAEAQRRLFLVAASVQHEGFRLDGHNPGWHALCNSPELVGMTEGETRERLIALVKVEGELEK